MALTSVAVLSTINTHRGGRVMVWYPAMNCSESSPLLPLLTPSSSLFFHLDGLLERSKARVPFTAKEFPSKLLDLSQVHVCPKYDGSPLEFTTPFIHPLCRVVSSRIVLEVCKIDCTPPVRFVSQSYSSLCYKSLSQWKTLLEYCNLTIIMGQAPATSILTFLIKTQRVWGSGMEDS